MGENAEANHRVRQANHPNESRGTTGAAAIAAPSLARLEGCAGMSARVESRKHQKAQPPRKLREAR
eukprot:8733278-Pyramimonas_sp.AAC.1